MSATPHSFSSIVLKFCRCFVHGLKMSMGFGHYFSLFITCELREKLLCERNTYNSIPIFRSFGTLQMFLFML